MGTEKRFKNKSLKMETIIVNKEYSFTINFGESRNSETRKANELYLFTDIERVIKDQLNTLKRLEYCSLQISPELSPIGILHWHGKIKIHNILRFYWKDLYRINDYAYEIDEINDIDKWETYVHKQEEIWTGFQLHRDWDFPQYINKKMYDEEKE